MKPNIAILTPKMVIGGAESYIIAKAKYLCQNGYRVIVLSEGGENVQNLPQQVKHFVVENISKAPFSITAKKCKTITNSLIEILQTNSIDVVEAHNGYPIYYGSIVSIRLNIPCIYNLLNELSHKKQRITNSLLKNYSRIGQYFCLTKQMNNFVEKEVGCKLSAKIIPIPVVSLDVAQKTDQNYILSVSRFSQDKLYLQYLIEGFAESGLADEYSLKIVGDGECREQIENAVKRANCMPVELLGIKTGRELNDLYANCSLYVGVGTTLLLAASIGKPILNVGFTVPENQFTWGFWGEKPKRDADCIVGIVNEDKDVFFRSLKIVRDKQRLKNLGCLAKDLYDKHYDFDSIMKQWEMEYISIASAKSILSRYQMYEVGLKACLLRILREVYVRLMKKVQDNFKRLLSL